MSDRYYNRKKYFQEQSYTTGKYVIPFLNEVILISSDLSVAEIGCGEGGNLKPFLEIGCTAVGIDLAENKISNAENFFSNCPYNKNLTLIADDIYNINPDVLKPFDIIIIRDTLEHIHNQDLFLEHLKKFIKPTGKIFLAFPPWRMPFGGHQQMCENHLLSKLPFFHLLPDPLFIGILKIFGETESKVKGLLEIKKTRISIRRFKKLVCDRQYQIDHEAYYLINPNYEVKFNLRPRKLPKALNIPFVREFLTTTYYCILSTK